MMHRIIETIFRKNRFYVRTENGRTYPRANYVWLKHNPSFESIPKGYVIHHLDLDPTSDDPSNLVLMYKFHHIAYHLKYKEIISEVTIDHGISRKDFDSSPHYPIKKPSSYQRPDNHKWFLACYMGDGKRKNISRYQKKPFLTREDAESAIGKIWPTGWN